MPPYISFCVSQKRLLVCQPTLHVSANFTDSTACLYSVLKLLSLMAARIGSGIVEMHQSAVIVSPAPSLPDGRCVILTFGTPPSLTLCTPMTSRLYWIRFPTGDFLRKPSRQIMSMPPTGWKSVGCHSYSSA